MGHALEHLGIRFVVKGKVRIMASPVVSVVIRNRAQAGLAALGEGLFLIHRHMNFELVCGLSITGCRF
jgi:hypothetical protein